MAAMVTTRPEFETDANTETPLPVLIMSSTPIELDSFAMLIPTELTARPMLIPYCGSRERRPDSSHADLTSIEWIASEE